MSPEEIGPASPGPESGTTGSSDEEITARAEKGVQRWGGLLGRLAASRPPRCAACGKHLEPVGPKHDDFSPHGGTIFTSYGNYGSGVYDSMTGAWIEIVICDDCLRAACERGHVLQGSATTPSPVKHYTVYHPEPEPPEPTDEEREHLRVRVRELRLRAVTHIENSQHGGTDV